MTGLLTQRLAQLMTAGAVVAFATALARHHSDPSTATESGYLAWLLGITLGGLALSRHSAATVVPGGLLLTFALCLPAAEGTRGALVLLLLVAIVAMTSWRVVHRSEHILLIDWVALALAWQGLLRSERLVDWQVSIQVLIWLVALPLAAAVAAWWHGRRHGPAGGFVLFAATLIASPGFGVVPVAVLIIVAALCGEHGRTWQAALVASAGAAAALFWQPSVGPALLILVAVLALRHLESGAWLPWVGALLWAAFTIATEGAALSALGWIVIGLPIVLLAPAAARPLALTALFLGLSYRPETASAGLAPAFALAALTMPPPGARGIASLVRRLQTHWSVLLLAWVALRAAYPWLREPLVHSSVASTLNQMFITLGPQLLILAAVLGAVAAVTAYYKRTPRWIGLLTLIAFVACASGRQPQPLNSDTVVLTSVIKRWVAIPEGPVQTITIDGFLNQGELVGADVPVAYLVVNGGGRQHVFGLRNGRDTADWAARRLESVAAPPAWISWFSADGTLAQRYRFTQRLPVPMRIEQVKIVRSPRLPPETQLAVSRVGVR